MSENKDYISRLNKARRNRNQKWDPRYILMALAAVVLIGIIVLAVINVKSAVSGRVARGSSENVIDEPGTGLEAASASNAAREEEEKAKEEQEIQDAVDAYQNLGIVQVSGYVNIRETPDMKGNIIGKISGDGACEVLGEEGEWLQIKSGKVEGYIKAEYVLTGSEALEKAGSLLKTVADVNTEGLKVRTQPSTDSEVLDIVGSDQSFDVLEELDEWVKIDLDGEEGYLFKDYVNVGAKLDEALTISEVMYGAGVSDVRMALSNFAKQYIGNPYVWGGTSLTKGADCSGFVLSVFRNYGISLPHSSRAQANCGTKISLSELKPGDLVFYGNRSGINHVAIYVGGGQVVHASNPRVGITISGVSYRSPVKAVRVIKD